VVELVLQVEQDQQAMVAMEVQEQLHQYQELQ
jgi:hypothetical protein